jgi:hypothetical protein
MVKLNYKLKGTTLIETIVSMMLIVLIMTIIIQSVFQVNKETGSVIKPYAYFLIKQNLIITDEKMVSSETKEENSSITIIRNLTMYENYKDLYVLEVKAMDTEGETIISAKRIIPSYELKNPE